MTLPCPMPRAIRCIPSANVLRLLALLGLFLLPMQMRAGAEYVHPHAVWQLLLAGGLDHHHQPAEPAAEAHGDHGPHASEATRSSNRDSASPDIPASGSTLIAAGGLAVSLTPFLLLLLTSRGEPIWPRWSVWFGLRVAPDLPPPRWSPH